MKDYFLSEGKKLKEIIDKMKTLISTHNSGIKSTHYYISLGNKNLLQAIEETLNDYILDKKQRKKHIKLLKTFLDRSKSAYFLIDSLDDPELLELKSRLEDAFKSFGFTANDPDAIFSLELENTIQRLEKKEVLL